jgi:hypothetical protein
MMHKNPHVNSSEYNKREKALQNKLNKAKARVNLLRKRVNTRENAALGVIKKHLTKPGGLLNRIRHEPNYGINYAKTRGMSSIAKVRTNENWAKMLRKARREGRLQGMSIGHRRTIKNIFS